MPPTDAGDLDDRLIQFRSQAVTRRQRRLRSNLAALLLAVDLCTLALVALHTHGPPRQLLGLVCCLAVPGWAIVGLLRLHDAALELGLTVAVSIAALVVVAQLAMTFGVWGLTTVDLTVCVAAVPSLFWQAASGRAIGHQP